MSMKKLSSWMLILILMISQCGCSSGKKKPPETTKGAENTETVKIGDSDYKLAYQESIKKDISIPYTAENFKAKVQPYKVSKNLSNIVNLAQFGSFSPAETKFLSDNSFFVSPAKEEQLFYTYEKNAYLKIPNFITTDSVLQVYHIFYDYTLRQTEKNRLINLLESLTKNMLSKSIYLYKTIKNPDVKTAAMKNAAYFATAKLILEKSLPNDIPPDIKNLSEKEYGLIEKEQGFMPSAIFPYKIDYSVFRPRGHYTNSEDYKRYFRAMMWYGQAPFPLYKDKEEKARNVEQTLQALLVTYSLFLSSGSSDADLWENIYEPTVLYIGKSDDLTIFDYKDLLFKVYGKNPDIEKLNDSTLLNKLYEEAEKLPEPKIQSKYVSTDTPVGKQFRFMGQRYIPDSEIIGGLVDIQGRLEPSGLDVLGVLGSDRAYDIASSNTSWDGYADAFKKLRTTFFNISDNTWRSNMYYGWLWTLKSFTTPYGKGYPSFMTNAAWQDKSLNTALGSWAELRHDTILYGKQIGAEAGGGGAPKVVGYVEPSVDTYERLLYLSKYSRENLSQRSLLTDEVKGTMLNFEELLNFLIKCSIKELNNQELTDDEYWTLFTYGARLEDITSTLVSDDAGKWSEITSESGKNMSVISDYFTNAKDNSYMQAAVGPGYEIYVVVPIGGKLYLTRGAVFSYYEFRNTSGKRLTDEEWQKMIKDNKLPDLPKWTQSFIKSGKGTIPLPKEPYGSPGMSMKP